MTDKGISERLRHLIPKLEHGRETHRQWRDYLRANPRGLERNPECGDADFHERLVGEYDERISAITEAADRLSLASAPADGWKLVPEEVRQIIHRLRFDRPGFQSIDTFCEWIADELERALASAPAVDEWIQPAWRPFDTYPKDQGVYRNGTRCWLWHEKLGVVWGFVNDLPSGTRCELYRKRGGEWRLVTSRMKAAKGLWYWMPPAPEMPEPPVAAAPQRGK